MMTTQVARTARNAARRHLTASWGNATTQQQAFTTAARATTLCVAPILRGGGTLLASSGGGGGVDVALAFRRGLAVSGVGARGKSSIATSTATARAAMGLTPAAGAAAAAAGAAAGAAGAGAEAGGVMGAGAGAGVGVVTRALDVLRVYHDLSKFKLSAFVVSTAAAGYVLVGHNCTRRIQLTTRSARKRLVSQPPGFNFNPP